MARFEKMSTVIDHCCSLKIWKEHIQVLKSTQHALLHAKAVSNYNYDQYSADETVVGQHQYLIQETPCLQI